jgi:hypothetical protein
MNDGREVRTVWNWGSFWAGVVVGVIVAVDLVIFGTLLGR